MTHVVIYSEDDGRSWRVLFDGYGSQVNALADMREQARLHPTTCYEYHTADPRLWAAKTKAATLAWIPA